jgi:hypothetical protein
MRRTSRRGYSLIEAAVTLFLLSVITATSVFMIGASSSTGSDAVAQSSADASMDAIVASLAQDGALTSDPVARLSSQYPDMTFVSSNTASTSSSLVSVAVSDGVAAVAVSGSSGDCWMLRLDMMSGDSNHIRRYVLVPSGSSRTCTASAALGTDTLSSTKGSSWSRPLVWSESSSSLLPSALVYLRADSLSAGSQRLRNEGTGGPSLDAVFGTGASVDAYDPVFMAHDGSDYLYTPSLGNYVSSPDSSWLDLSGDVSLTAHIKPNDWTPASPQALVAKYAPTSGSMSYALVLASDGSLSARWSSSVSPSTPIQVSSSSAAPFQDGQAGWVRVKMDTSESSTATSFWVSSDGTSWSQLGSSINTASSAPITLSSEPLVVGALSDGSLPYLGKVYRADVRATQGSLVAQFNPSTCNPTAQNCPGATGEVWSVTRASGGLRATVVSRDSLLFGDSVLSIPDTTSLDVGSSGYVTVLARLRVFDDTAGSLLFGKFVASDADLRGYGVKLGSSSSVYGFASLNNSSGLTQALVSSSQGNYVTVVLRIEPILSKVQLWIDSTTLSSTSGITSPWPSLENSHFFTVGGSRSSSGVSANASMELSSIAIFDRSLTQEEINRAASEISR